MQSLQWAVLTDKLLPMTIPTFSQSFWNFLEQLLHSLTHSSFSGKWSPLKLNKEQEKNRKMLTIKIQLAVSNCSSNCSSCPDLGNENANDGCSKFRGRASCCHKRSTSYILLQPHYYNKQQPLMLLLPYFTSGLGKLLHLSSAEAVSVWSNVHKQWQILLQFSKINCKRKELDTTLKKIGKHEAWL